jgi:hypothetical protein
MSGAVERRVLPSAERQAKLLALGIGAKIQNESKRIIIFFTCHQLTDNQVCFFTCGDRRRRDIVTPPRLSPPPLGELPKGLHSTLEVGPRWVL